jgi:hypothetical protein
MRRGAALLLPPAVLPLAAFTVGRVASPAPAVEVTPLTHATAGADREIREFPVASPDGR